MTDDVYTTEYLAQQEDREERRADLHRAIADCEEALEMAKWQLIVWEQDGGAWNE